MQKQTHRFQAVRLLFCCISVVFVGQDKGQLGGGSTLAVHIGRSFAHAHRAALFHQFAVEGEHIAGGDLLAEAGISDAAEQRQFSGLLLDQAFLAGLGNYLRVEILWQVVLM